MYVLEFAANVETTVPLTYILAIMVNLSFGKPAFVARLIPVKNTHVAADFLYAEIQKVLEMINDDGGRVFSLLSDDLSVRLYSGLESCCFPTPGAHKCLF